MRKFLFFAVAVVLLSACSDNKFRVTVNFPDGSFDGKMCYLTDYDTGDTIDSVVAGGGCVVFEGIADAPYVSRVAVQGGGRYRCIVEKGDIVVDAGSGKLKGTPLNEALQRYRDAERSIEETCRSEFEKGEVSEDEAMEKASNQMERLGKETFASNKDNVLGYIAFLDFTYGYPKASLDSVLKEAPELRNMTRVKRWLDAAEKMEVASAGKMFLDFTVTGEDGAKVSLSDFVGRGQVTLVDFWASWCGPCMREIEVIREIYSQWSTQGLQVLGVAVWDSPGDSSDAVLRKSIPWPQILNTQSVATDLYGIVGIPHIIIFDCDGTILSRGLQGDELKEEVARIMGEKLKKR